MAGPLWQQLLDFLRLQETLDAIAAGNTQANVDIEALRASLETAARDVPAIREALDFVKTVSETPGAETIGGVNVFRLAAQTRAGSRALRKDELDEMSEAIRKRVFAGREPAAAVHRDAEQAIAQQLQAQIAEKPDLFGPEFVAIVRGAAVGTGAAILAQAMPEERPLGVTEATWRERIKQPLYGGELDREKFEKAYQDFESWRKGIRAQARPEPSMPPGTPVPPFPISVEFPDPQQPIRPLRPKEPQPGPQLGPQPESAAARFDRLAGVLIRVWQEEMPGALWDAELVFQVDKDGRMVKDAKGHYLTENTEHGVPKWKSKSGQTSASAEFMNSLSALVAVANKGDQVAVKKILADESTTPMGRVIRRVLPAFYDTPYAPSTTVKETVDNWVYDYDKAAYATARSKTVVAEALDKKIATAQALLGRTTLTPDEILVFGTVGYGTRGWEYPPGINVPETLRGPSRFMGIPMPDDDPREVMVGNTLTRTEIVEQFRDAWAASKNLEFKNYLTNELGAFDELLAAKLAFAMMSEYAASYRYVEKTQAGWRPYDPDSPEPLPHSAPMSPAAWLDLNANKVMTRADEQRRVAKAKAAEKTRRAEADVLTFAQDIPDPVKRDFVLANVKLVASTYSDIGGELSATVDHLYSLDKAQLEAAEREVERKQKATVEKRDAARDKLDAYAVGLPAGSPTRDFIYKRIDYLTGILAAKGGDIEALVEKEFGIDKRIKDEAKAAERVTWADLGRLSEDQRVLAVYGFYKRDAEGNIRRDDIALEQLQQRPGESTGDWVERAKVELRTKLAGLSLPTGATVGDMAQAGFVKGNLQVESNALDQMFKSGVFGTRPLSPQDKSLWGDYQTMVEFQAQQVAPSQQEAYRLAAAERWPAILKAIEARLGPPKKKGDAAEMLAEEASRKQAAAEMIRQTDVPAMVGVRKVSTYDTREEIRKGSARAAGLPETPSGAYEWPNKKQLEQAQERATTAKGELERIMEIPAVQRVIAGEAALRGGADPQAVTSAIAWEAQQAAARFQIQYAAEQKLAQERYLAEQDEMRRRKGLPTLAEEQERQIVKPQPFRPTFWRFGPSFGRR